MLINIILLILFFIILLWKSKVVEGQSDVPVFNILPGFLKDELILYEKEKKDDRPKETILDTLDEKGIYNDPDQNDNNSPLNKCVDSNDKITAENYKELGINSSTKNLKDKTKNRDITNFNLFGINFVSDLSNTDIPKSDSSKKLCSLVDILYDKNTSMEVRNNISNKYGNCFYKSKLNNNNNQFENKCPKSCFKYLNELPDCNKYILSASKCPEINIDNINKHSFDLFNMAILPPNGNVFYNCVAPLEEIEKAESTKSPSEMNNLSFDMIPQTCRFNNICNPEKSVQNGKNSSCTTHSEEYCENLYEIDNKNGKTTTYNCMLRPGSTTGKASHVGACFKDLSPGGLTELCETNDVRNDYKDCRIASVPGIFLDPKKVEYAVTIF